MIMGSGHSCRDWPTASISHRCYSVTEALPDLSSQHSQLSLLPAFPQLWLETKPVGWPAGKPRMPFFFLCFREMRRLSSDHGPCVTCLLTPPFCQMPVSYLTVPSAGERSHSCEVQPLTWHKAHPSLRPAAGVEKSLSKLACWLEWHTGSVAGLTSREISYQAQSGLT